jgi:hypothetical protein
LSGAPILRSTGKKGEPLIACGCVSIDASAPEAFQSFLVPGVSTGAMLWPALGLALPVSLDGETHGNRYLADLLPFLDIRSPSVSVSLSRLGDLIELLYEDARQSPPYRFSLKMTAQPA